MRVRAGRRKSIAFFITLGACLVAVAIGLNVGWILLTPRQIALLVVGIVFFLALIAGLVLNTIFLVREIKRNAQHDAFIHAVTHELKTPLASIRLYLETLQTRDIDPAQRAEFYSVMLADSDRLLHTVEQVLRAARTGHYHRLNPSIIDLDEIARECSELARKRHHLDANAIHYASTLQAGERAIVKGDAEELRVAVSNLLDNAIKYSRDAVKISVEVANLDAKRVAVRVRDTGLGIPGDQLKRIFKRFHRVPRPVMTRIKGTGLGLFIVRSIVEKHGGRAFAESKGENQGSTFTILLPRMNGEMQ
jgi:signal transduction histidine kinase